MENRVNPIKQNIRVKQFLGWFITLAFPFCAVGIMETTKIPLLAAVVYWGVCGVLLRFVMEKRLPYFNMQISKVKKETVFLLIITIGCSIFYARHLSAYKKIPIGDQVLNAFIFALFNGCFEQLVWINIIDLAGCKDKMQGFIASFIYVTLIHIFFWFKFMPVPQGNITLFIFIQLLMFIAPAIIYVKTKDITIWSIQHIIYDLIVVFFTGFGAASFLHMH